MGHSFPGTLSLATHTHQADTVGPVGLMDNSSQLSHGKLQGCKEEKHLHSTRIAEQTSNNIWNNQSGKLGQD